MAGRLVEHHAAFGMLLDEEKATLILDHGGHGNVRSEAFHEGLRNRRGMSRRRGNKNPGAGPGFLRG
ncbi:hypothetical protein D3C75_1187280 [compost metagenome]